MAPNNANEEILVAGEEQQFEKLVAPHAAPRKHIILYDNVFMFAVAHVIAIYGLYLTFTSAKWATILFQIFTYMIGQIGITAGVHRLWSHKAYKAKLPLQILLMIMNTVAYQNSIFYWARDHRMHHKYCDTDADPHNSARGFFYSHVGWLLVKRHPELMKRGHTVDVSDLRNNKIVMFQRNNAIPLFAMLCFALPTAIPVYLWGESLNNSWNLNILRFVCSTNASSLINSAAHMWGYKPYDKSILPAQNMTVSFATLGEGFHNYHHVFPYDYRAGELGNNKFNLSTLFIDFFAWIGWAYDLKTATPNMIKIRSKRTGDGTDLWGRLNRETESHNVKAETGKGE